MAKFDKGFGFAIGEQTTEGTVDGDIAALASSVALADGLVLGDSGSGIDGSGITISTERVFRDKARIGTGTAGTLQASHFLREDLASFSFSWPFAGSLVTADGTPADAEFQHSAGNDNGIDTLLECCGLGGAVWDAGVGWQHEPAALQLASAKVWVGSGATAFAYVIRDIRGSFEVSYTAGDVPIATVTMDGVVDSATAIATLPTFVYGVQSAEAVPPVQSAVFSIGGMDHGFSELTLSIDNGLEKVGDSNSSTGLVTEAQARNILVSATLYSDTDEVDDLRDMLLATGTDVLTFGLGTAVSTVEVMERHSWTLQNMEVRTLEPTVLGSRAAWTFEGVPTDTTADTEIRLVFE